VTEVDRERALSALRPRPRLTDVIDSFAARAVSLKRVHPTGGPLSVVLRNAPFFVAVVPRAISARYTKVTRGSGASLLESSAAAGHFRSRGSLAPEPRVTFAPLVCPGEHRRRPKTEHSCAPYTDRVFFVESVRRTPPRQFQRIIAMPALRSPRSPKFVTSIEWRARQDSNLRPTAPEAVALSS
jgi:hypothetical protein